MARPNALKSLFLVTLAATMATPPATATILFQQTVAPVNGKASFDYGWLSYAPGVTWIGIDHGQLTSGQANLEARYFGQFWSEVPDYSEAGSRPELYTEDYFAYPSCHSVIGNSFCAEPLFGKNILMTRMNGTAFEVDWRGFTSFDNCHPFNGIYDQVCAVFGFGNEFGTYNVVANATANVTFTIYNTDPTNGAIPEPGIWALLIAGFGLTGAVMRRRRLRLA
jgi:hypothetical protein